MYKQTFLWKFYFCCGNFWKWQYPK